MSWYSEMEEKFRNKLSKDCEYLVFTAQKGSLLDRIWNKEDYLSANYTPKSPAVEASEALPQDASPQ